MKKLLFAGTASAQLGKKITQLNSLTTELGEHEVVRFANSEVKVTVKSTVQDRYCIIVQSTSNPTDENLMELLLTIDALRREGASRIKCVLPYFGYARQNIQHRPGECVSVHVVIKVLESLGVDKVVTVNLHDEGTGGIFSVPFSHYSALPLMARTMYDELVKSPQEENKFAIGSPDQGGIERARKFADSFYRTLKVYDTVTLEKKRNLEGVHDSKAVEVFGEVKGKKVIFVDDIATSGGTIMHAASLCLAHGAAAVYAAVVHPDFGRGVPAKIQSSQLTTFYTTNTIEKTVEDLSRFSKIRVVDTAEIFKF